MQEKSRRLVDCALNHLNKSFRFRRPGDYSRRAKPDVSSRPDTEATPHVSHVKNKCDILKEAEVEVQVSPGADPFSPQCLRSDKFRASIYTRRSSASV